MAVYNNRCSIADRPLSTQLTRKAARPPTTRPCQWPNDDMALAQIDRQQAGFATLAIGDRDGARDVPVDVDCSHA